MNQEIVDMKKAGCYDHLTPAISSFVKAADLWRPIKGADLVSQQEKEAKEKEDAKAGAEKSDSEEEEPVTAPVRKRKAEKSANGNPKRRANRPADEAPASSKRPAPAVVSDPRPAVASASSGVQNLFF